MIPPKAIIFKSEKFEIKLNLGISKKKFDFFDLKIGAIKTSLQPCFFLIISCILLCAEPMILNCLLLLKFLKLFKLLNEGIYTPSSLRDSAIFRLFERKNFLFCLIQESRIFLIIFRFSLVS